MRRFKKLTATVLAAAFMLAGTQTAAIAAQASATAAPAVAEPEKKETTFKQFHAIVDLAYVKKVVDGKVKGVIIDSRPEKTKYDQGFIPKAVNLPTSQFDKFADRLPKDKNTLVVFYCGGLDCPLSHKAAFKAEEMGYKNVKVFAEGYPAWVKAYGPGPYPAKYDIFPGRAVVKDVEGIVDGSTIGMVIDARPKKTKYDQGHIPGSISLPTSQFEKMKGLLPADKNTTVVFYCGGLDCPLSHKAAFMAQKMGYKNVKVFAEGYPAWTAVHGETAVASAKAEGQSQASDLKYKSGPVEGSIDVAAFQDILQNTPESIMLVDVKDPKEYEACHYPTAVNIPTEELEKKLPEMSADKPIVFVCSTGARSGEAYYMVKDVRPDIKEVYYVDAMLESDPQGSCKVAAKTDK